MKLSVIIVNYNVRHFLEQCLHSVYKAINHSGIETEVIVVDNNSVDDSIKMIRGKFPHVQLMENKQNYGFSYANNQAIKASTGEYILLLNPDTVVEEDTFDKVTAFMDEHPDAGGLGVKMIDGKGNFLPESKRGLPTPAVAFYKIFGLAKLFPRSRKFGRYHLGYLDKDQTHEVEILSGAFMLLRKSALEKTGLLDETFFMYGEDIDLSYRLIKEGYKNYYFPETRIIHYKGESTKKSSVNYIFVFYNAMIIFAKKHFSQHNAKTFSFLINLAIYLRAGVAIFMRFLRRFTIPGIDALVLYSGFYFIIKYYAEHIKFPGGGDYPHLIFILIVPFYIFIWLITVFFSGGYDQPVKISKIIRGILVGTGIILIVYALLPETLRFSRVLTLIGAVWAICSILLIRLLLHLSGSKNYTLDAPGNKRIIIVGSHEECLRVHELLKSTPLQAAYTRYVSNDEDKHDNGFIGALNQLKEIITIHKINEVIFCAKDLSSQCIMDQMSLLGHTEVEYKIAPPEGLSIIGSNSINTSGDLYVIDINSITKNVNIRNKRLLDVLVSVILLTISPLAIFFISNPLTFVKNIFLVLAGKKSWVAYNYSIYEGVTDPGLPNIRQGVLTPADNIKIKENSATTLHNMNISYAKNYSVYRDLSIVLNGFRHLGRK